MTQKTTGLHRVLSAPWLYEGMQRAMGNAQAEFVRTYLRPEPTHRLLDIGCGTSKILHDLPHLEYVGFDPSAAYIDAAKAEFGDRGTFFVAGIDDVSPDDVGVFDLVLAKGVLHHLDDQQSRKTFELAAAVVKEGGRVVTFDGCFAEGQSPIARWIIQRDRGKDVRTPDGYRALAEPYFAQVQVHVRHDLMRMPYTHAMLECSSPRSA